jgi:hypothetical protein
VRWLFLAILVAGCRQIAGLDDPLSGDGGAGDDADVGCSGSRTFTTDGSFILPADCSSMTVEAFGGGGGAGVRNAGANAARGGNGGHAIKSFTGLIDHRWRVRIGRGGRCETTTTTTGGYGGGAGGIAAASGADGSGVGAPGGMGGAAPTGTQPGGAGGKGGYGGGGGGGGGDTQLGNSGGGASTFDVENDNVTLAAPEYVVAGGGGGAGTSDQNGDVAGVGGDACNNGLSGTDGGAGTPSNSRAGGGGGGGGCSCRGGTCDATPTPTGGAGGMPGSGGTCGTAQNGADGKVIVTYP